MSEYEWYQDGYLTRRRKKPTAFSGAFWAVFMCVNIAAIVGMIWVTVWAFFDIHDRLPFAQLAAVPALVMMGIRRIFKRGEGQ